MATIRARVRVEVAGRTVRGFPMEVSLSVPASQTADYVREVEATFEDLPASQINPINLLLLKAKNAPVTLRFGGQTTVGVELATGGILGVVNGAMPTTPTLRNDHATANASIVAFVGGTSEEA